MDPSFSLPPFLLPSFFPDWMYVSLFTLNKVYTKANFHMVVSPLLSIEGARINIHSD